MTGAGQPDCFGAQPFPLAGGQPPLDCTTADAEGMKLRAADDAMLVTESGGPVRV